MNYAPYLACLLYLHLDQHSHSVRMTFDPLSPSLASSSKDNTTFKTLTRERAFRHPPVDSSDVPLLDELVKPHIESFNALIEDEGEWACSGHKITVTHIVSLRSNLSPLQVKLD